MKLPKSLLNAILVGVTMSAAVGCAEPEDNAAVSPAEPAPEIDPNPIVDQDPPLDPEIKAWDGDACPGCGRG